MFGKDGYVTSHVEREYHKFSCERAERFLANMRGNVLKIQETMSKDERDRIENRRKLLRPMIETTLLLGRSLLAFRGHRDSGPIRVPSSSVLELDPDEGNFRTLLGYRAMYDPLLAEHLKKSGRNAQYSYKTIQNEIVGTAAKLIQKSIVDEVNSSEYFAVLAEETSDVARLEQLSISVRYIREENGIAAVQEKFLTFVEASECTGPALAELITSTLLECGLDLHYLVGQGYDGATSMSGVRGGVQALIRRQYPCALKPAQNAQESMERAEACISFKSLYIPVLAVLAKISESEPEAHSYLISVNEKRFVFCLCLLSVAMAALKTLSEQLQSYSTTLPKEVSGGFLSKVYTPFMTGLTTQLETHITESFDFYGLVFPHQDATLFETEFEAWKRKCRGAEAPDDLLSTLDACDESFFPIVHTLLQILGTIPVSTATPERTFSSLKFLKNYLRSTMKEDRLTGLALLFVHRGIGVDVDDIIAEFITRNRRISFS
ncbi:hypothetical protein Aduo_012728 [Ancylostoma duodenale]